MHQARSRTTRSSKKRGKLAVGPPICPSSCCSLKSWIWPLLQHSPLCFICKEIRWRVCAERLRRGCFLAFQGRAEGVQAQLEIAGSLGQGAQFAGNLAHLPV